MDFITKYQVELQQGGGIFLTLVGTLLIGRGFNMSSFLSKNYNRLTKTANLKQMVKNPKPPQYVLLKDLNCVSSPQLFKEHMKVVDRQMIGGAKQFSIKRQANNFKAQIVRKGQKYNINCDCSTFNPYVSSPLLINNYDLIKKIGKRPKLTMVSCGFLYYNTSEKEFIFYGDAFGTTTEQIQWVWGKIFRKNMYFVFFYGLLFGIGIRLCCEHIDKVYDYIEKYN